MLVFFVMNKVEKAILKTLAFFDLFGRPLTLEELWKFLYRTKTSKMQVLFALQALKKKKIIFEKKPYFALISSKNIFNSYLLKRKICQSRWRKVDWVVKVLRLVPFVKNISVTNSLAFRTSNEESDIDILVVSTKNKFWLTRALTVLLLEIIGQNKNKWVKAGKFCFGFGFTEDNINLDNLRLKRDIYFTYWLATLTPVYDRKIYKKLIAENSWLSGELPNWYEKEVEAEKNQKTWLEKILLGNFGERLEKYFAKIQIKKIQNDKENYREGASVIAGSTMMKLHAFDKREFYQKKWQEKLKELKI
jgi:hypothetical protein